MKYYNDRINCHLHDRLTVCPLPLKVLSFSKRWTYSIKSIFIHHDKDFFRKRSFLYTEIFHACIVWKMLKYFLKLLQCSNCNICKVCSKASQSTMGLHTKLLPIGDNFSPNRNLISGSSDFVQASHRNFRWKRRRPKLKLYLNCNCW